MARARVADVLARTLQSAGVRNVWGVVGDSLNGFTDALRATPQVRWQHVRHEEVAAFAAGAEAQLTSRLGVCAGSCGPGNLHLINGLYECHRNRVPVLAIAAQIPSPELGGSYFQETHPERLFRDCSHYCELISSPSQMPRVLEIAMRNALTKDGVAVIVLPGDVALMQAVGRVDGAWSAIARPAIVPAADEIDRLARLLNAAERVTILAGAGTAGARPEVLAVAEALKAPIVHTLRGKEHIEHDNPYDVGMTGLIGFSSGYHAMMSCDALLMLGADFPYRQFYPSDAKIAQIDRLGDQLGRRARLDVGVIGDLKPSLALLKERLKPRSECRFLDRAQAHYRKARAELDALATGKPRRKPIHPQHVASVVDRLAAREAVFTVDVGETTVWAARYLKLGGGRRLLGSFLHGTMANALPQAIGAQAAMPGRQVVSLSGDGGLTMLMGEILSLRQLALPVKIVVFNNGLLGFVDLEMKASGFLNVGTELVNPDFARMAESVGLFGRRVETPADLEPALTAAFAHDGPALVDVVTNPMELAMPPKIEASQALGFSLYAGKAIINGRGNDLIELVNTNLFR
jgi:pyruvate dehydrogenase (quinone)